MTASLLHRARQWVDEVHPHVRHLERTLDWVVVLEPGASEALRVAAVTHDIERAFPEPNPWVSRRDWASAEYNRYHQDRCADLIARWLDEQGAPPGEAREIEALVRVHEDGGWREADLLQAADSISFLETMGGLVATWEPADGEGKLRAMADRIKPELVRARELAAPLLEDALAALRGARAAGRGTGAGEPPG